MVETVSQMNIRLSSAVKEAGDATLSKLEVTPTEFVRKVWELLAQGTDHSAELSEMVLGRPDSSVASSSEKCLALERMRTHYQQGMESLGIDVERVPASAHPEQSDSDLYADSLVDRMIERGTWGV